MTIREILMKKICKTCNDRDAKGYGCQEENFCISIKEAETQIRNLIVAGLEKCENSVTDVVNALPTYSLFCTEKDIDKGDVLKTRSFIKLKDLKNNLYVDKRCSWCKENNFESCTICEDAVEAVESVKLIKLSDAIKVAKEL